MPLQAQGLQRLVFLSECKEHGVEVVAAQGPPMLEGSEGEFLELALAFGKQQSVVRAQDGARNGLRDRSLMRRLPASPKEFFGYRWDGSGFVPSETYPVVQGIWRMLLEGKPDRAIASILTRAGIPTPKGQTVWPSRTIGGLARNPAYCGRYTALRYQAVAPKVRQGPTYGKTSRSFRDIQEHVVLDGLVQDPVVTPEDFEQVQVRRAQNKSFGGRRTRDYLLRGMIRCGVCGRRYSGQSKNGERIPYAYRCAGNALDVGKPRCGTRLLHGPPLEDAVWRAVCRFLEQPERFFAEVDRRESGQEHTVEDIRKAIQGLERQLGQYTGYRQRAYDGLVRGITDEETYRRVVAGYRAHEVWLNEELARQRRDMASAERKAMDATTVRALYATLQDRLTRAGPEDQRFVLECLGTQVMVGAEGITVELAVPAQALETVGITPRC